VSTSYPEEIAQRIGEKLGTSRWVLIDHARIDHFA
jgi:hypothetical protein